MLSFACCADDASLAFQQKTRSSTHDRRNSLLSLVERSQLLTKSRLICSSHLLYLFPVLEKLKGRHGRDATLFRHFGNLVDVDLGKDNVLVFFGHLFKDGTNVTAGSAPGAWLETPGGTKVSLLTKKPKSRGQRCWSLTSP